MNIGSFAPLGLAAALLAAGAVHVQAAPPVTDIGPPPAEERNSTGAVVLENSLVKAQRDKAFAESSNRTGIGSVGRVLRATTRAAVKAELASTRAAEAAQLYQRGAGSLTER